MLNKLKTHLLNSGANPARKIAVRFSDDKSGVAAMEFAFLLPIMLGMYFGLAEIAHGISVDRQVSHATNVAGDLATQVTQIPASDFDELLTATMKVLNVKDPQNVKIEIASYDIDPDTDAPRLLGKATMNDAAPAALPAFDPATIDVRILNETSGAVVTRVAYKFEPIKVRYLKSDINLNETFLLKPRRSAVVQFGDGIGSEISCTAGADNNVTCGGSSGSPSDDDDD